VDSYILAAPRGVAKSQLATQPDCLPCPGATLQVIWYVLAKGIVTHSLVGTHVTGPEAGNLHNRFCVMVERTSFDSHHHGKCPGAVPGDGG